jgi:hypothetical protein
MNRIKKYRYLSFLIILNIIIILGIWHGYNIEKEFAIVLIFFSWFVLIPLNGIYLSKRIYSIKNKRISTISTVLSIVTFLIFINPGFFNIPGEYYWLMKYETIQHLSSIIPGFVFIPGLAYIILCDISLKFIWNKIIGYNKKK